MEMQVPHKHWYTFTILHGVTTHKNVTMILTTVRTWNLTNLNKFQLQTFNQKTDSFHHLHGLGHAWLVLSSWRVCRSLHHNCGYHIFHYSDSYPVTVGNGNLTYPLQHLFSERAVHQYLWKYYEKCNKVSRALFPVIQSLKQSIKNFVKYYSVVNIISVLL
jgi:hypothetical protein